MTRKLTQMKQFSRIATHSVIAGKKLKVKLKEERLRIQEAMLSVEHTNHVHNLMHN